MKTELYNERWRSIKGYEGIYEVSDYGRIRSIDRFAGFMPYAMLYRDERGKVDRDWARFQREWLRPAIVSKKFGEVWHKEMDV